MEGRLPVFQVRRVRIGPGAERAYVDAEWQRALVVVEQGAIELENGAGVRCTFVAGDVLCLAGLRLRVLRNRGRLPAVLSATARRTTVGGCG